MTYLVDANVLSEPTRLRPDSRVVAWLNTHEGDFVVDSIILGELSIGILSLPRGRKRTELEQWFEAVVKAVECLPWDGPVSLRWARLVVELKKKGRALPVMDTMIAATALEHDLTVVTRNVRDFQATGVKVVNPFL
jgi:predicted nucleic acid-binding protein